VTDKHPSVAGKIPQAGLIGMIVAGAALPLYLACPDASTFLGVALIALQECAAACAVMAAAGGYGMLVLARFAPKEAPLTLRVVTACALGLWMLSTAVLAVGSAVSGAFAQWLWWPIIGAGIVLAGWQGRDVMRRWQSADADAPKRRYDGRVLVWVLVAVAVGVWLSGALCPPGFIGRVTGDAYDVLEYHMQVPREFFNAGRITELRHNVYSYYPLGVEMLSLLAMALRGGAYDGMYLGKILHGSFAFLAVAGVFGALKERQEARARFSAGLLATCPMLIYLASMAMSEMAIVCYFTLGLLWLREWIKDGRAGSAATVGLMIGGACTAKYLSVGFVAGPLAAVMLLACFRKPGRIAHVLLAGVLALAAFSPWLIRNATYTGNPVFPLATDVFGAGHWSPESQQRWQDGHGADAKPPVPEPPGWKAPAPTPRVVLLWRNFLTSESLGNFLIVLAGVAVCVLLAEGRAASGWNWALAGVIAAQLAVWVAFTRGMPTRFILPAVAPMALLGGHVLAKLFATIRNPLRKGSKDQPAGWGRPPAVAIFVATCGISLFIAFAMRVSLSGGLPTSPAPGEILLEDQMRKASLPEDARVMLVGDAKAFYYPPHTVYATVFDTPPLLEMADKHPDPLQLAAALRQRGITHIVVDWTEIWRLAGTYGYPAPLSAPLWPRLQDGRGPGLPVLEAMVDEGLLHRVGEVNLPRRPRPRPNTWAPFDFPNDWPQMTTYSLLAPAPSTRPAGPAAAPAE